MIASLLQKITGFSLLSFLSYGLSESQCQSIEIGRMRTFIFIVLRSTKRRVVQSIALLVLHICGLATLLNFEFDLINTSASTNNNKIFKYLKSMLHQTV